MNRYQGIYISRNKLIEVLEMLNMIFAHRELYGKTLFYPLNDMANKFLNAFPHSSGKRKTLTMNQINVMKEMSIPFIIKQNSNDYKNTGEGINEHTGNDGL